MKTRKNTNINLLLELVAVLLILISLLLLFENRQTGEPERVSTAAVLQQQDEGGLTVHFIDVGQGDCILAVCGGETLLIDAGDNGTEQAVINYIRRLGVTRLDYAVATHQHADHIGGMAEVLHEFDAGTIIMPRISEQLTPTNNTYTAFLKEVENSSAKKLYAKTGMTYTLGEAAFTIIAPISSDAEDLNDMSVVIRLDYGENSFLFTGDAASAEENDILAAGADIDCDVLKVGHHGSATSSKKDFLAAVTPEKAVIMCGENNSYNHPNPKTLKRISAYTADIYRTDICGDIVFTCDKSTCRVDY